MTPVFDDNATVLFQGDSITDAGRSRENNTELGRGYASMAAAWFSALYPEKRITFLNRGISGNRAVNLEARWQADCLDLKPDWVSIMIGINDTWRRFDSNDPTSTEVYENAYRNILTQAREQLDARFILIEPFVLPHPEDRKAWREDLDPRITVVNQLAKDFDAIVVPMDRIMNEAAAKTEPAMWAGDGVHPSACGHALIAQSWLRTVSAIPHA